MEIGYKLCSEEHSATDLVLFAKRAEEIGFSFAMISDHFHPWTDKQGQSPFVWSVLGAIAQVTDQLYLATGVTCPTMRVHPAIIAQSAATVASMMPGRFALGVGSGENLNEHIFGDRWPPADIRQEMLAEAIEIIRKLWQGNEQTYYGDYFTVEDARIFSLPDSPPPILIAGSGKKSAELAGRLGDGFISTSPKEDLLKTFREAGGDEKPCLAEITMCWARQEKDGIKTALESWPTAGLSGELTQELRVPAHFEQASKMVTEEKIAESVICGPDLNKYLKAIGVYVDSGFDRVWLHQVGPDQDGFFQFCETELLPKLAKEGVILRDRSQKVRAGERQ